MNRSRVQGMLAIVALVPVACSEHRAPPASAAAPSTVIIGSGDDPVLPAGAKSTRVEIRSGVKYVQTMTSTASGTSRSETLNGQPFQVLENEIRIGSSRYGPLAAGDRVVIDTDGVRINGELRGPLP